MTFALERASRQPPPPTLPKCPASDLLPLGEGEARHSLPGKEQLGLGVWLVFQISLGRELWGAFSNSAN